MNFNRFFELIKSIDQPEKTFLSVSFGCRVNAAEVNQLSQILIASGFKPTETNPDIILINTCSITKKGDIESLSRARVLNQQYPSALIFVTGCANLEKLENLKNVYTFDNKNKEEILVDLNCSYSPAIKDKFSHTNRYLLKVQSGCTHFCSYCTVPFKRKYLWSLDLEKAVDTVQKAIGDSYKEIIITGVNLDQYKFGLSNLVEKLLNETTIELVSFGSIPINCIDDKLISFFENRAFSSRLSHFLHIPIQSGSDKILKLMNRPYDSQKILETFNKLKKISLVKGPQILEGERNGKAERDLFFGTDIIVGFPTETDEDFQSTKEICETIGFQKIHCFQYSSRPNTLAKIYYESNPIIKKEIIVDRSRQIRNLV